MDISSVDSPAKTHLCILREDTDLLIILYFQFSLYIYHEKLFKYLISEYRMSDAMFKQDLPPKGGYAPIHFKRIPAKTVSSHYVSIKYNMKKRKHLVINTKYLV